MGRYHKKLILSEIMYSLPIASVISSAFCDLGVTTPFWSTPNLQLKGACLGPSRPPHTSLQYSTECHYVHGRPQEFFQGGANLWGGPKKICEGGPPYFFQTSSKICILEVGGGVVLMPTEFFFLGAPNLLRWTSKIYKKGGMSITIYNISTGA